jgi:hypothetical protein
VDDDEPSIPPPPASPSMSTPQVEAPTSPQDFVQAQPLSEDRAPSSSRWCASSPSLNSTLSSAPSQEDEMQTPSSSRHQVNTSSPRASPSSSSSHEDVPQPSPNAQSQASTSSPRASPRIEEDEEEEEEEEEPASPLRNQDTYISREQAIHDAQDTSPTRAPPPPQEPSMKHKPRV